MNTVCPWHIVTGPVGLMAPDRIDPPMERLIIALPEQPSAFVTVYLTVSVPPETPVTTPVELTVAIAVLLLVQTPPLVPASDKVTEVPEHNDVNAAEIALTVGPALIVMDTESNAWPQIFVIV